MKSKNFYFLWLLVILSLFFDALTTDHTVCRSLANDTVLSSGFNEIGFTEGVYKNRSVGVHPQQVYEATKARLHEDALQSTPQHAQINKSEIIQKTQKLQMPFIANNGQLDETVKFYAKTFAGSVFVTKEGEIVYSLPSVENKDAEYTMQGKESASLVDHDDKSTICNPTSAIKGLALKEEFVGGKVTGISGESKSVTRVNYFIGNDPSQWKNNVSTYDVVDLGEIYSDIHVKLKAYGNNVEKLFYIRPDADPGTIRVKLNGAKALKINEHGELVAETDSGPVTFTKPVAYQEIDGKRVEVEAAYMIRDREPLSVQTSKETDTDTEHRHCFNYGFTVASYDHTKDLIIDPLLASTYLGGSMHDWVHSIALDTSGNVYVTGWTESTDFPTTSGAYDTSYGNHDVFVSKLDGGLTSLLASTYLGGSGRESGNSLAIDASGNVYVTGETGSTDFPTTSGAYDTSNNVDSWSFFVAKLDGELTNLLASTYLGESRGFNYTFSLALDTSGNVYVTGITDTSNFPTTIGAYDTSYNGDSVYYYPDVFISKLDGGLTNLLASTFLGGSGNDWGSSLAIDISGNVYVTGLTDSTDFPTTSGAYDTSNNGTYDAFVSKLDSGLTSLLASTYLGGSDMDGVFLYVDTSLSIDTSGNVFVTGITNSTDFPTTSGAYDTSNNIWDVFISKLNGGLTSLLASTYLGGSSTDWVYSLALDTSGNVYVTGYTESIDFPTTSGAYDTSYNGGGRDVFVSKLDGGLTSLLASTYLGGSDNLNYGFSLALDTSGNVYVTGVTGSTDFPTTSGAYDTSINGYGSYDVFVSKLDSGLSIADTIPPIVSATSPANGVTGVAVSSTITATFDEAMDDSTINTTTFTVSDGTNNISGTVSYSGTTATFTPSVNLNYSTTYTATITTGVKDLAGNALASTYTWSFTTGVTGATLTGLVEFSTDSTGAGHPNGANVWNTLGGDQIRNLYVTLGSSLDGEFVNTGNGASTSIEISLSPGTHTFMLWAESATWTQADFHGLNLFFNGNNTNPGVSVFAPTDMDLPTPPGPAFSANTSTITWDLARTWYVPVPGAGTLSFVNGSTTVTLTDYFLSSPDVFSTDRIQGYDSVAGEGFDFVGGFTLQVSGPPVPPTVSSTSPASGATNVAVNNPVTATFSETMDATTIKDTTFILSEGTNNVSGTVSYSGITATFTPSSNLAYSTTYTATITTGVTDTEGNAMASNYTWSFTTEAAPADTTPPAVSSTSPTNGATDVDVNATITTTFDEAMDASTIDTTTFTVSDGTSNIGGTVSYSSTTATFTPSSNLAYSTTYTATITTGVKDLAGNAIASNYTWSFTTVAAPNSAPIANAGTDQSAYVGNTVTLDGSGSSDPDGNLLTYSWSLISVPNGSMVALSNATSVNPSFTVDKAGTYEVSVTVSDGSLSSTDTVTISTLNSAPVANAGPDQSVYVGNTVTLNGSGSTDVDGNLLTYTWAFTTRPDGSTATLSDANVVNPTFTVDKAGTYVISLIVNDGTVNSVADTVTISTLNSAPVANAGPDQSPYVTQTVTLDGSGSTDVDGNLLTYTWAFTTRPDGSTATLSDTTIVNPTFTVDKVGTYVVSLIVNDGTVNSTADTVTISTLNSAPVANAGADQSVYVGNTVTLDGSGSTDVDGNLLTYTWAFTTRPDGSTATLSNTMSVNPTFTVDKTGTYVVSLVVNDGTVNSVADTVTISTLNSAPVANAGPDQSVYVGNTATLDGSGSTDVDGNLLTYRWAFTTIPTGSTATLSDTTVVNPTFTVDKAGTYVISLIVNDGTVNSVADTVTISTLNSAPVANAGADQTPYVNDTVTLDGSGSSDVDGNLLTYKWAFTTMPTDSTATLSDTTIVNPTFTVDKAGTYVISLIVNDGAVNSAADTVTISTLNSASVANAGTDQSVYVGNTVTLDGSGSTDVDGNLLTYSWAFTTRPDGSTATLANPTSVNPTFTVDKAGTYVISLIVNDGAVNSAADTVTISTLNSAPIANAGADQSITITWTTVQLDGTQSYDPDGDVITYQWTFASKPDGSTASLQNADTAAPSFTADVRGDYVIQLMVSDPLTQSSPDTVIVSFTNIKPVADAGTGQSVNVGETVTLDGSGSTDANGDSLTYQWTLSSVPSGSLASIADTTAMVTTFVPDVSGTYVVQLVVNDGVVDSDPVTIQILAVTSQETVIDKIRDTIDQITLLDPSVFKNANMQNTFINKLNAVIANIDAGNYADALDQLRNDILGKTDGCATSGAPDKNDWIKDCASQNIIYPLVQDAITALQDLM